MVFKRIFLIALILGWLVGCVIVICTSVGYTPFRLKASNKNSAFQMIPQGWGFFTRNPREEKLIVYKKIDNSLKKVTQPNFSKQNLFGLSRKGRMRQMQIGNLILPYYRYMQPCEHKDLMKCNPDSVFVVKNPFEYPILQGEYLIQKQATLPWAWSKSRKDQFNPYEILMIHVE